MATPTWTELENAIQLAVASGTGLSGTLVRWGTQSDPQTYNSTETIAQLDIIESDIQSAHYSQSGGPNTITQTATSEILFTVRVQIYNFVNVGVNSAWAKLNALVQYLLLETTIDTLDASTICLVDQSNVQRVPKLLGVRYQDRATVDLRFRSLIQSSSTQTTIRDIQGEAVVTSTDGTSHTHYPFT